MDQVLAVEIEEAMNKILAEHNKTIDEVQVYSELVSAHVAIKFLIRDLTDREILQREK